MRDEESYNIYNSSSYHVISQSIYFLPKSAKTPGKMFSLENIAIIRDEIFLPQTKPEGYVPHSYCKILDVESLKTILKFQNCLAAPNTIHAMHLMEIKESCFVIMEGSCHQ
jgi:hypothetical protein